VQPRVAASALSSANHLIERIKSLADFLNLTPDQVDVFWAQHSKRLASRQIPAGLPTRRSAVLYLQFPGNNRLKLISLNSLRKFVTIAALASSTVHAAEPESLDRTLEPYLKEFGLLALAAAVFKEGVVIAAKEH
jgi:hypothetical protein